MSSYGMGIGPFITGLARGAAIGGSYARQDVQDEIAARRLQLEEDRAARETKNDEQDRAWKIEDRSYQDKLRQREEQDYQANAPVRDLAVKQASAGIKTLQESDEAKSVKAAAAGEAKAALAQNPEKYGSFDEAYNAVAAPKIKQFYLSKGDTAGAEGWDSWNKNEQIKEGKKSFGAFMQAYRVGDIDAATKHISDMVRNDTYFSKYRGNITPEQLKDEKGDVVGMRLKMKDPNGKEFTRDFTTPEQIFEFGTSVTAPDSMYELMRADSNAAKAGKAKQAEKMTEAQKEIIVKNAESNNRILEEAAKSGSTENPGTKTRAGIFKSLMEMDTAFAKLPPDQQNQIVNQKYEAFNNPMIPRSILPQGAPAAAAGSAPTPRRIPLVSRPQAPAAGW